jgi:hypothetical protein
LKSTSTASTVDVGFIPPPPPPSSSSLSATDFNPHAPLPSQRDVGRFDRARRRDPGGRNRGTQQVGGPGGASRGETRRSSCLVSYFSYLLHSNANHLDPRHSHANPPRPSHRAHRQRGNLHKGGASSPPPCRAMRRWGEPTVEVSSRTQADRANRRCVKAHIGGASPSLARRATQQRSEPTTAMSSHTRADEPTASVSSHMR